MFNKGDRVQPNSKAFWKNKKHGVVVGFSRGGAFTGTTRADVRILEDGNKRPVAFSSSFWEPETPSQDQKYSARREGLVPMKERTT